jgi:hypothetical protein
MIIFRLFPSSFAAAEGGVVEIEEEAEENEVLLQYHRQQQVEEMLHPNEQSSFIFCKREERNFSATRVRPTT